MSPQAAPRVEPGGETAATRSRRVAVLAFLAGALAAGAVTILVLDVGRDGPVRALAPEEPEPAAESVAERWPGARLTTAAAATGTGQSPRAQLVAGTDAPPSEPLADVARKLSPEWRLAYASPDTSAERRASRSAAPGPAPAAPPAAPLQNAPITLASADAGTLQYGIGVRVYRSGPDVAAMLSECDSRGFFARPACRAEVCRPYVGVVAECPLPEQTILH
ncbi:hypothetical protein FOZ76_05090 [Verticiella sediminum]|uniref:Uncharacterized protein n=1 Tax=Verticiella sediminum TaxID=1247510 RepID=A0A556AYZ3_9BURK|nr:hypothetical protein [Verticiella sediminum]TSH98163.1 hypothetical protein FOZ76_05090 [Verticiella sediminum]